MKNNLEFNGNNIKSSILAAALADIKQERTAWK
jgi:hypothetical protein